MVASLPLHHTGSNSQPDPLGTQYSVDLHLRRQCVLSFWLANFGLCVGLECRGLPLLPFWVLFGDGLHLEGAGGSSVTAFHVFHGHFKQSSPACLTKKSNGSSRAARLAWGRLLMRLWVTAPSSKGQPAQLCSAGYYGRPFEARNKTKGGAFAADKDYFSFRVGDQQVGLLGGVERKCLGANCWPCACRLSGLMLKCIASPWGPSYFRFKSLS